MLQFICHRISFIAFTVLSTSFGKSFFAVFFCLAFYTEDVNLQTFVMAYFKTICRNYVYLKCFILVFGFKKSNISIFPIAQMTAKYAEIRTVG